MKLYIFQGFLNTRIESIFSMKIFVNPQKQTNVNFEMINWKAQSYKIFQNFRAKNPFPKTGKKKYLFD